MVKLLGFLVGKALEFYCDKYTLDGGLSTAAKIYKAVKKLLILRFEKNLSSRRENPASHLIKFKGLRITLISSKSGFSFSESLV